MIRLGMRLTLAGGRPAVVRLCLMGAGVAVGVALLLAAAAFPIGMVRSAERAVRDSPAEAHEPVGPHLLWATQRLEAPAGRDIISIAVATSGPGAPRPLGARHVPAPGNVLVSPALARALSNPQQRRELPTLPGRVVGRLGDDALRETHELAFMTGWTYEELRAASPSARRVTSFKEIGDFGASLGAGLVLIVAIPIVVVTTPVLLAPVLVLIGSTARVGARRREARLAAMRLVGATPGQVRWAVAVEAVVAGVMGAGVGIALAWGLRALLAGRGALFASDFTVPTEVVVVIVTVVPLLAGVSAVLALRRVEVTPLGVTRRSRVRPVTRARWLPLGVGWALVGIGLVLPHPANGYANTLGLIVVLFGMVRVGPRVLQRLAGMLGRGVRRPSALLAARRLESDPRAGFRPGTAVALAVFATTVIIVVASSFDLRHQRSQARARGAPVVRGPDLVAQGSYRSFLGLGGPVGAPPEIVAVLSAVRGVEAAVPVYADIEVLDESTGLVFHRRVVVADCPVFARAVRIPAADCRPGVLASRGSATATGSPLALTFQAPDGRTFKFSVPVAGGLSVLGDDRFAETRSHQSIFRLSDLTALVPPELVPPDARAAGEITDVLLRTDGSAATARRVAGVLAAQAPGLDARAKPRAEFAVDVDQLRPFFYGPLLFAFLVAACSLCVTTVDSVFERRRPLAALRAVGASPATLRGAAALEAAAPLLVAGALGVVNGLVAGMLYARAFDAPIHLPWLDIGALCTLVVVSWLVVAAVVTATIGRVAATDSLRTA